MRNALVIAGREIAAHFLAHDFDAFAKASGPVGEAP